MYYCMSMNESEDTYIPEKYPVYMLCVAKLLNRIYAYQLFYGIVIINI